MPLSSQSEEIMKAALPTKPESIPPSGKKVVKKVPAKAGASLVVAKPVGVSNAATKKDGIPKRTPTPGAKPAGSKEETKEKLITEAVSVSNAQVAPKPDTTSGNSTEDKNAAALLKKSSDLDKPGDKPKTKTVIVKKKIVVIKKKTASAATPASKSANNANLTNVPEKLVKIEGEATEQQPVDTKRDWPLENTSSKEDKPVSVVAGKIQKVVKKVVVKGKGSATDATKDNKQDTVAAVEQIVEAPTQQNVEAFVKVINSGISKNIIQEALPPPKSEDLEELYADEFETMDSAAEAVQLYDNHEYEEEPEFEEDVDKQQGEESREEYQEDVTQTRPVSDRQKRKKLEVFVGGLDKDASEDDVRAAFNPVGDVMEVRLMMNPVTGKNKGYAFVRFASAEQAGRAATEFAAIQIRGKECGVLPNQDNDTLFIGNISRDWKSSEVLQKLKEFGINGVEELTLIADPQNEALNRGYAFLELATHYDAVNAFQRLHRPGVMFGYDRPAKVSWAQPLNDDVSIMLKVKSVFVDGIPPGWTDEKVKQNFGKFGDIERIVFARNMPFAKRKDFAFVNFTSCESASACVEAFRETELADGDRKFKVKVSLTRPIQKGRADKWSTPRNRGPPGQGRGQAGRGEGWFSARFSSRGSGRGFGRSGNRGVVGRGGKRLFDEDEVRMMLKAAREEEGWSSTARGRGGRYSQSLRGSVRSGYAQDTDSRHTDTRFAESYREQTEPDYTHDGYNRPISDLVTSRTKTPRSGRDEFESQHPGSYSRSRVSHYPDHSRSPRHEVAHHQRYEQGAAYGQDEGAFSVAHDYNEVGVGMKRPAAAWDEAYSYYDSGHRGNPRARTDYSDSAHFPEATAHYSSQVRSPAGPATQSFGMRQTRSGREGQVSSFYDGGSGLGKAGMSATYDDRNYNTILPEASHYLSEIPERRESSVYPSSFYGGHTGSGGYDFQTPGYY